MRLQPTHAWVLVLASLAPSAPGQGAPGRHWAFLPPERPPAPEVRDPRTRDGRPFEVRSPIDAFVAARLVAEGLRPSGEAAPEVLCRRLHLDLIGLPPSPGELDDFVRAYEQAGEAAYHALVERLLGSPHFGERWARWWLDAARYADSDGYEKDMPRRQWTWRDWVIGAFNRDLPYDQFIVEQVAGDLLPGATQAQRVATGFLRNSMVNEEGAIVAEQFRMEAMFDRMDCLGKAVLGLTLQCGQCHSHKYDPLTQEEYYRMLAFLNDTHEATSWVYGPEQLRQVERVRKAIAEEEARLLAWLGGREGEWRERVAAWGEIVRRSVVPWEVLEPKEHEWIGGLAHPERLKDGSVLTLGFRPTHGELYVVAETRRAGLTGLRLEALTHGDLPFGGPGRSSKGTFAVSEVELEARPLGSSGAWTKVPLANATADFAQPEGPIDPFFRKGADDKRVVGPASFLVDGKEETAWGSDRGPGRRHRDLHAVLQIAAKEPLGWPEGTELKVWLKFRHGGEDIHGRHSSFLGRLRLAVTAAPHPAADLAPRGVLEALRKERGARSAADEQAVLAAWRASLGAVEPRSSAPDASIPEAVRASNARIEELWREHPEGDVVLNLVERPPDLARETFVLERGSWQRPVRNVEPGVPAFLHALPSGAPPATRLAFARWLADRRSPTTARVAVNRLWQALFGQGLVETPEDFGLRAAEPSHPEILDWLAVDLMEPGAGGGRPWSLKGLLRRVVESSTYRQASRATSDLLERDPRNRLLGRGPRFRAEAEVVRDIALSASGLIAHGLGGPSVFPPVPESVLALSFLKVDFWQTATGPERYRRSLYVFRRRSLPDPMLSSFDAPNGELACVRRVRSNTPLAALATLNEPVFVEAARALALRILRESGSADPDRAAYGFRLCTGRRPRAEEVAEVLGLLEASRKRIADGWIAPKEIAFEDPGNLPELPRDVTPAQAAAWTIAARVLLNLDETVTKS
ncbi:MAG: DUF1553 domain-containing protein [Planctomycetes bacterium]|nr:DUF1553 domain-containing protein [Planctomycetota bacterium]